MTHLSWSMDIRTELQATEYYFVEFDAPATAVEAETASGVPVRGDGHPDDATRRFKQKRPEVMDQDDRRYWRVQVDYSSLIDTYTNPLGRPPTIDWDYDNATETYFIDNASEYPGATDGYGNSITSNQAVTNTAGEPFEKLSEREDGVWTATWSKNVPATWTVGADVSWMQKVNSDAFSFDGVTIAKFSAKISGGRLSGVQYENGFPYRVVTIKLKFKNGGWIDHIANVGYQEMDSGKAKPIVRPALSDGTAPATKIDMPWPLDQDGVAYADPTTTPDELNFYPYHTMAFTPLFADPAYAVFGGGGV